MIPEILNGAFRAALYKPDIKNLKKFNTKLHYVLSQKGDGDGDCDGDDSKDNNNNNDDNQDGSQKNMKEICFTLRDSVVSCN